jgi:hypothetical protein
MLELMMNRKLGVIGVNGFMEKSIPRYIERSNPRASYGHVVERRATSETAT